MSDNSVAITAVGLVSPLGMDLEHSWQRLKSRDSGIRHLPRAGVSDCFQYQGQIGACDPPDDVPRQLTSQIRFLNRGALLGLAASRQAFLSSGISQASVAADRRALYIGAGDFTSVGYEFMYPAMKQASGAEFRQVDQARLNQAAIDLVNPFFLLESLNNNLFSFLSAYLNFTGSSTSMSAQSPCGSNAVELAYRSIKQGRADIALAVGCGNWLGEVPLYEMEGLGLLSSCRQGAESYRPLSRGRDGFIPGEGGAALLLENAEAARARGADILGFVCGVGNTLSTEPERGLGVSPDAYRQAIDSALEEAGLEAAELGFVIAHGSGTRKGDGAELEALAALSAEHVCSLPVTALKAQTGHMGAASDVAEIVFGLKAMQEPMVPATCNFIGAEPAHAGLTLSDQPQTLARQNFLSMSMGIGGQISAVMVASSLPR